MSKLKDLLSTIIDKLNSKISTWEEIPDKPFGVKTEMVDLLPEQTVTTGSSTTVLVNDDGELFEIGTTYIVIFNGTMYKCVAREKQRGIAASSFIGNGLINDVYGDEGNGEPFNFVGYSAGGGLYLNVLEPGVYNIAIYEGHEVIEPLDINYLPIEELKKALGLGDDA